MAHSEERRFIVSTRYGGTGGSPWDDGLYHGVRKITLRFASHIYSIAVGYYKNGENINAESHGGGDGEPITITLDTDEFITNISGYVDTGPWLPRGVIRSLKFKTNIREFGPYGDEVGNPFTFTVNPGDRIIGFFGRTGSHLDAIGVHVAHGMPHP